MAADGRRGQCRTELFEDRFRGRDYERSSRRLGRLLFSGKLTSRGRGPATTSDNVFLDGGGGGSRFTEASAAQSSGLDSISSSSEGASLA
jgi:hypothetical protein